MPLKNDILKLQELQRISLEKAAKLKRKYIDKNNNTNNGNDK